jgi:hypothetical protein
MKQTYSSEEGIDQFWSIRDKMLMILEDRVDCKDGILSNERVSVFLPVSDHPQNVIRSTNKT